MELLEKGLELLGLAADPRAVASLRSYLLEIELWNRRYGLVHAAGEELIVRHVLDSLAAVPLIRRLPHAEIADVGSGAGFPGIPLALFLDDAHLTLIERSGKKAGFLRNAVALCGIGERVSVFEGDFASATPGFEMVLFRALGSLPDLVEPLLRLTAAGGSVVAYKGRAEILGPEIAGTASSLIASVEVIATKVPFLEEERNLVVFRKTLR